MPSGATGDWEKRTPWLAGQRCVRWVGQDLAPWCLENPNDSAAGQRGRGYPPHPPNPPTGSNLLLSSSIMVTPWPQASYLQKINGRGRSHVRLRGGVALPAVELVAGFVRRGESQQPQDAAHTSAAGNRSRSNQTDLPLCLPAFALAAACSKFARPVVGSVCDIP